MFGIINKYLWAQANFKNIKNMKTRRKKLWYFKTTIVANRLSENKYNKKSGAE